MNKIIELIKNTVNFDNSKIIFLNYSFYLNFLYIYNKNIWFKVISNKKFSNFRKKIERKDKEKNFKEKFILTIIFKNSKISFFK